jgi:hypothetical protein
MPAGDCNFSARNLGFVSQIVAKAAHARWGLQRRRVEGFKWANMNVTKATQARWGLKHDKHSYYINYCPRRENGSCPPGIETYPNSIEVLALR